MFGSLFRVRLTQIQIFTSPFYPDLTSRLTASYFTAAWSAQRLHPVSLVHPQRAIWGRWSNRRGSHCPGTEHRGQDVSFSPEIYIRLVLNI